MLTVEHDLQSLPASDGGDQHVFNWKNAQGMHLFYAMYQSGNDEIPVSDGNMVIRGKVLRIQTNPRNDVAPSDDNKTGCLAIRIDSNDWEAADYELLAGTIEFASGLDGEQQVAAYCQLASLYNLLATQYGRQFSNYLQGPSGAHHHDLISDPKLLAVSRWFERKAQAALEGKVFDEPMELPLTVKQQKNNDVHLWHGIETGDAAKFHMYTVNRRGNQLLRATYQTGDWGETVWINYDLTLPKLWADNEVEVLIPLNCRELDEDTGLPLTADAQIDRAMFRKMQYALSNDQQGATFLMIASLYRIAATHYQTPYSAKTIEDARSLSHYIRHPFYEKEARKLVASARLVFDNHKYRSGVKYVRSHWVRADGHARLEDGDATARAIVNDLLKLDPNYTHADITFMPPRDFQDAWDRYRESGAPKCARHDLLVTDYSPGLKENARKIGREHINAVTDRGPQRF